VTSIRRSTDAPASAADRRAHHAGPSTRLITGGARRYRSQGLRPTAKVNSLHPRLAQVAFEHLVGGIGFNSV
jgi:hypothetical protein